jgi:hypothetical protein
MIVKFKIGLIALLLLTCTAGYARVHHISHEIWGTPTRGPISNKPYLVDLGNNIGICSDAGLCNVDIFITSPDGVTLYSELCLS